MHFPFPYVTIKGGLGYQIRYGWGEGGVQNDKTLHSWYYQSRTGMTDLA